MKLTLNQQDLRRAVDRASAIMPAGNSAGDGQEYAYLMLLQASENLLSIRSTSGTAEILAGCPAEVGEPGSVLVDGTTFGRIVRRCQPDSSVELRTKAGSAKDSETGPGLRLLIHAGRADFDIPARSKEEFSDTVHEGFPEPADPEGFENVLQAKGRELTRLISKTNHATESSSDQRFYLTGIYLHVTPEDDGGQKRLVAVATDGRRLALASVPAPADCKGEPGMIMPQHLAKALSNHLDPEEEVSVGIDGSRVRFEAQNYTLTLAAIDGTYPDYQRVIPQGGQIEIDLHVENFKTSLDRVTAIAQDDVRVTISGDSKSVDLTMRTATAESSEPVPDCIASQEITISTNADHLRDILGEIEGDRIVLQIIDEQSPCILGEKIGELDTQFVVMPYRT